jgi:hypothetical protein
VVWTIDLASRSYTERGLSSTPGAPPRLAERIQTAGYDYRPAYAWKTAEESAAAPMLGRQCLAESVEGLADYAQARLRLVFCERRSKVTDEAAAARLLSEVMPEVRAAVETEMKRRPDRVLLAFEHTSEPPIAPAGIRKAIVETAESAVAPPGIFDLPEGCRRTQEEGR